MQNRSLYAVLVIAAVGFAFGLFGGCLGATIDESWAPDLAPAKKADQIKPDLAQPPPPDFAQRPDMAEPPADMTCGGMQFQLAKIQPNVMLVLDRSGSMGETISSTSTTKKWDDLKAALTQLVSGFDKDMRFGLDLYSTDDNCAAGGVVVAPAPLSGATVMSKIASTSPAGNTPTAATMQKVIDSGLLKDATRTNAVVLATDGLPNCGDTDVKSRIEALKAQTPPVKTYVIGVGSATASNPTLLDSWAEAGGTALAGGTSKYYQTNSPAELKAAFDAIAGGLLSCTFKLDAAVPDPTQVYVWNNGTSIPNDAGNGFTYDENTATITLNGASCRDLRATPSNQVQVTYGCATPPPVA